MKCENYLSKMAQIKMFLLVAQAALSWDLTQTRLDLGFPPDKVAQNEDRWVKAAVLLKGMEKKVLEMAVGLVLL